MKILLDDANEKRDEKLPTCSIYVERHGEKM